MAGLYDVVVIGASIAGYTAAIELGRCGMRTLIVDHNVAPGSVVAGHGIVSSSGALTGEANVLAPFDKRGYLEAGAFITSVLGETPDKLAIEHRSLGENTISPRLLDAGIRLHPANGQPVRGIRLAPGFTSTDAFLVDPASYGKRLAEVASKSLVDVVHSATVTRFKHQYRHNIVHYRSQLAWERAVFSTVSRRVIDTVSTSPWGRQTLGGASQVAPVAYVEGLDLDRVVMLPDAPAYILRPYRDGALVVGHAASIPAAQTACVGLEHWLTSTLGCEVSSITTFGVQPTPGQEPRCGASGIPRAFWAGGHGMWELVRATVSGLWIAARLLDAPDSKERFSAFTRLRAKVRNS